MRKHATNNTEDTLMNDYDDIVSDDEDELDSDDMDSDGVEEFLGANLSDDATSHAMSQQQDFVGF